MEVVMAIFTPDVIQLILVAVMVVVMVAVAFATNALRGNERLRAIGNAWELVNDAIVDLIFFAAASDVDFSQYEQAAAVYNMDTRMYWVVQQTEMQAERYLGFDVDFLELYHRAQRVYEELHADEDTIV